MILFSGGGKNSADPDIRRRLGSLEQTNKQKDAPSRKVMALWRGLNKRHRDRNRCIYICYTFSIVCLSTIKLQWKSILAKKSCNMFSTNLSSAYCRWTNYALIEWTASFCTLIITKNKEISIIRKQFNGVISDSISYFLKITEDRNVRSLIVMRVWAIHRCGLFCRFSWPARSDTSSADVWVELWTDDGPEFTPRPSLFGRFGFAIFRPSDRLVNYCH